MFRVLDLYLYYYTDPVQNIQTADLHDLLWIEICLRGVKKTHPRELSVRPRAPHSASNAILRRRWQDAHSPCTAHAEHTHRFGSFIRVRYRG